jgi:threonine/homoserine/homoserine lactone efflux protein
MTSGFKTGFAVAAGVIVAIFVFSLVTKMMG